MSPSEEKGLWIVPGLGGGLRTPMTESVNRFIQRWNSVFPPSIDLYQSDQSILPGNECGVMDGMVAGSYK